MPLTAITAFIIGAALLAIATKVMIHKPLPYLPGGNQGQEIMSVFTALAGSVLTVYPLLLGLIWIAEPFGLIATFYITVIPTTLVAFVILVCLDSYITEECWHARRRRA